MESRRPSGGSDDLDLDAFTGEVVHRGGGNRRATLLWVAVAFVAVLAIPLYLTSANTRRDIADTNAELKGVEKRIADAGIPGPEDEQLLESLTQSQELADTIKQNYSSIAAEHVDWPSLVSAVGGYNPGEIILDSLVQSNRQITLRGRATTDSAVGVYHGGLERSNHFSRVVLQSLKRRDDPCVTPTSPAPVVTPGAGATATAVISGTAVPTRPSAPNDPYEIDDFEPTPMYLGETQSHNFYPVYDVDKVVFLAKAGHHYRITTSDLSEGVDTFVIVDLGGVVYMNDDRAPGNLSSQLQFQMLAGRDVDAVVTVSNRGLYGTDKWYKVTIEETAPPPAPTQAPAPAVTASQVPGATNTLTPGATITHTAAVSPTGTITPTPDPRDQYEIDDFQPRDVVPGGPSELHNFYPVFDVDRLKFLAKAGRFYRVYTSDLAVGVDTYLTIVVGQVEYRSDDIEPGDPSSEVSFQVPAGPDQSALVTLTNRGQDGPEQWYRITVEEVIPTPTSTRTPAPVVPTVTATPDERDAYEPDAGDPKPIVLGETQTHSFYPYDDVDWVTFLAKAGRFYKVTTSSLAFGVDTWLMVNAGGTTYVNEDREPGDLSSEIEFQLTTADDVEALVTIMNRGQYGPDKSYLITVDEIDPSPPRDIYEPDDITPRLIVVPETQQHTFYPDGDVDKVTFLAKAGRSYRVATANLASRVDTYLTVDVAGLIYTNDDRQPGDKSSNVEFQLPVGGDVDVVVTVTNRDVFGPDSWYQLSVEETFPTPVPTNTGTPVPTVAPTGTVTPDLRDVYERDDVIPKPITVPETQSHNFYPNNDVDRLVFLAKSARTYRVTTSGLTPGVDTSLVVDVGGWIYANDDRQPGDVSSEVVFQVLAGQDVDALITVVNRGLFGSDRWYQISVEEILATPTPTNTGTTVPTVVPTGTATPDFGDAYEPDDVVARSITAGETQSHNFYPDGDVDNVTFLAKAGRFYRLTTSNLASGVDTWLTVDVGGTVYSNDDRQPGDVSSEILFEMPAGPDVAALLTITNRGLYGSDRWYQLSLEEIIPTATPEPTPTSTNTPDLRDPFEPDDATPKLIVVGETQVHNFYPDGDVDKITFLAKAGRQYQVLTSQLEFGVDTELTVTAGISTTYNDDVQPGDLSSLVELDIGPGPDVNVLVTVGNRGQYGADRTYQLTVKEVVTAQDSSSGSARSPGLASLRPGTPVSRRWNDLTVKRAGTGSFSQLGNVAPRQSLDITCPQFEFVIVLELKAG